jgi:hypothetical protein
MGLFREAVLIQRLVVWLAVVDGDASFGSSVVRGMRVSEWGRRLRN